MYPNRECSKKARSRRWRNIQRRLRAADRCATLGSEVAEMSISEGRPCVANLLRDENTSYCDRLELGFRLMNLGEDDPGDEVFDHVDEQMRRRATEVELEEMCDYRAQRD